MILKTINILTSSLTKNFLTFICLTLSLSNFAKDVTPYVLQKYNVILEYDIDYDSILPPNLNTENEIALLELPAVNNEHEISLLMSPNINSENVFTYDSISSSSSNGEVIFEEEEYQLDYPVFDDYNDLSPQENLPINTELEGGLSSNGCPTPSEILINYSSSNESKNNLLILDSDSSISTDLE